MLKHEDLMKLFIVKIPVEMTHEPGVDKYGFGIEGSNEEHIVRNAFNSKSVNPELARLFQAAPMLYRIMYGQQQAMKRFESLLRQAGVEDLANEFKDVYDVLEIALSGATEGVEQAYAKIELRKKLYDAPKTGKAN